MSEGVRKAGSWTILVGAFVTIISTIMLSTSSWAVAQLTEVEPMKATMQAILKQGADNEKRARLFRKESHADRKLLLELITEGRTRLNHVEGKCDENKAHIEQCRYNLYNLYNKD